MHKYFEVNANGNNIRCKIYNNGSRTVDKAIIFCTGFAGHKDNTAAEGFAQMLPAKENAAVIVFNWPAHGDDVKRKSEPDREFSEEMLSEEAEEPAA